MHAQALELLPIERALALGRLLGYGIGLGYWARVRGRVVGLGLGGSMGVGFVPIAFAREIEAVEERGGLRVRVRSGQGLGRWRGRGLGVGLGLGLGLGRGLVVGLRLGRGLGIGAGARASARAWGWGGLLELDVRCRLERVGGVASRCGCGGAGTLHQDRLVLERARHQAHCGKG